MPDGQRTSRRSAFFVANFTLNCNTHNRSLETHRSSENATMRMQDVVLDDCEFSRPATLVEHDNILVPDMKKMAQITGGENSVRAHLVDHKFSQSLDVKASIELRSKKERCLVIASGPKVLASLLIDEIKITRFWGVLSSTQRIVSITLRASDPDGENAVYLQLDSQECLERLSHITGFDLE
jgi:hypothetical protein